MASNTQASPWTLKRLLDWTSDYLGQADVDQPRLCAEILLAETLQCQRIELYTNFDQCPDPQQLTCYRRWVRRCAQHEPVAYLVGRAHFYSLDFKVTPAVLVPRPETELLVSEAIHFLRQTTRPTVDVLDLGTGSGCIAVAVATHVVEAEIVAADNSTDALAVAAENVEQHDLQQRVTLCPSDLFAQVEDSGKALFDLIVTNPPYIAAAQFEKLDPNVREYEPKQALLGGDDGLDVIRTILARAEPYLADSGALMMEIAYDQAAAVIELFVRAGYLDNVETVRDQLGHQRVVKARKQ